MTPEERRKIYPKFIVEEIEKEEPEGFSPKKVTDFIQFVRVIWVLSSKKYQERFWVRKELPIRGDSYMETLEEFLSTGHTILGDREKPIEMTLKQREMLQKLYYMVEDFELADDAPEDPGHGVNDAEIISHPKWHQIQDYAKLVYEELSGDDLDSWEKSKLK